MTLITGSADDIAEILCGSRQPRYYACIRGELLHGSLKELSEYYCEIRDESGEGCSTFGPVKVGIAGTTEVVGYISYNGRVWDGRLWNGCCDFTDNSKLLYDNRLVSA